MTRAISECVRVTKPGGHVGLNEGLWLKESPPGMAERVKDAIGPSVPAEEAWRSLREASGLWDRVVRIRQVDPRAEIKSRIGWIGWPWILRACMPARWPPRRRRPADGELGEVAVEEPALAKEVRRWSSVHL